MIILGILPMTLPGKTDTDDLPCPYRLKPECAAYAAGPYANMAETGCTTIDYLTPVIRPNRALTQKDRSVPVGRRSASGGERFNRMLDAAGFPGGAPGTWVTVATKNHTSNCKACDDPSDRERR